ncbi:hypothetical protein Sjap_014621 [Stephania japonica]|uniref:Uncharacterized protein n=1 Tax=Stephania japonica TaxID=461633 RepID=A0AAP0NRM6_9MAGN
MYTHPHHTHSPKKYTPSRTPPFTHTLTHTLPQSHTITTPCTTVFTPKEGWTAVTLPVGHDWGRNLIWKSLTQATICLRLQSLVSAAWLHPFSAFISMTALFRALAEANLPRATATFGELLQNFNRQGLNARDLVILSGGLEFELGWARIGCGIAGAVGAAALCWSGGGVVRVVVLGVKGFVVGLVFGGRYVWSGRWVLRFPIVQRPPFFSFKMALPSAFGRALRLSTDAFICSVLLTYLLPDQLKTWETNRQLFLEHIIFFIGSSVLTLCWELNHHLHQVLHTKRSVFAPPKGSAAAETNPSEPLLAALEESPPKSLLQYLAYLDLCMVCESNVDTWRRAAFFEETGETYKRVISVCLKPLEKLASELAEGLEGSSIDKTDQLSLQLHSKTDRLNAKLQEAFVDMQLYVWCTRILAALTARSHTDDRFGVAQLSGSNAAVLSTLLSCLLAVEASMGKKTNVQAPNLMGPANIKWATLSTGRRDDSASIMGKKKGGPLHAKAYAMVDVLKTSIYIIVSEFHDEMMGSTKAGILEKHWIISGKPLYGARELLVQKLGLFLDFRAS